MRAGKAEAVPDVIVKVPVKISKSGAGRIVARYNATVGWRYAIVFPESRQGERFLVDEAELER